MTYRWQSKAKTVAAYLRELPAERRKIIEQVRRVILENLPRGYAEGMNWGMICYEIPLEDYPDTYNKQPLGCAALAAQKNYTALYLSCTYQDPRQKAILKQACRDQGKRLDMGKSCVRFRHVEDLPLDAVGQIIALTPPQELIRQYEQVHPPKK